MKRVRPEPLKEGWRARKHWQTRQRIADAGLRLFLENGFETTTLDAIAEASGIARRTFFHYFDSKEALLYVYEDEVEHSLRAALADVDGDTPAFEAVALALRDMIASFGSERARKIDIVVQSTDALRACQQAVDRWRPDAPGSLQGYVDDSFTALRSERLIS